MKINKYFRFVKKIFISKISQKTIPLIVILSVINRCNLNCWYCYGEHYKKGDWKDFTTTELLEIIRELSYLGTEIIQLQGGEPLIRDDIKIIINQIKKLGMICDMVTNGVLIPEKKEAISELDKICISLDGLLETNDRNRGKGSYNRIIKGIETAYNLKLPIRISTVLTSQTSKEDIDWLVDLASKYEAVLNFSPSFEFISKVDINKIASHSIPDGYLKSLFQYILAHKNKGGSIQFSAKSYTLALQWPFTYQKRVAYGSEMPVSSKYPKCYHGKFVFFINGDGSLYPCCNFWGRSGLNIRNQGLKKSIFSLNKQKCRSCYIPAYIERNLFFEGSPAVWWNYIKQVIRGRV